MAKNFTRTFRFAKTLTTRRFCVKEQLTLYERMGGEKVLRPMCNDIYDMHASDPLTAPWFGVEKDWNINDADTIKEHVFTFFSSGIGGPHEYKGRDMTTAHEKMMEMNPISEVAFHSLCYHVMIQMHEHNAGGLKEREEVLGILMFLKDHVMPAKRDLSELETTASSEA